MFQHSESKVHPECVKHLSPLTAGRHLSSKFYSHRKKDSLTNKGNNHYGFSKPGKLQPLRLPVDLHNPDPEAELELKGMPKQHNPVKDTLLAPNPLRKGSKSVNRINLTINATPMLLPPIKKSTSCKNTSGGLGLSGLVISSSKKNLPFAPLRQHSQDFNDPFLGG